MNNFFKIGSKIIYYTANKGFFNFMDDKTYLKLLYFFRFKKKLDFNDVKTYNEKLQWLKIYDRDPGYTNMVDKYEVRNYIKKKIGEKYLIPIIGKYNCFEEIEFKKLPNKFVLKCTHDSGGVVICNDKNNFDIKKAKKKLNDALNKNYFYLWREWPYKNVKPQIICEEFIEDKNSSDLKDYKFMCFNGKVKCIFVCSNRNNDGGLKVDFYDTKWNKLPFERHYKNSLEDIKKPIMLNEMIKLSEVLSQNIPFIRVDFYEVNGKIYFGELTFYPGSGLEEFNPKKYDEILGSWIILPKIKRHSK